jgi:hypothetical protein
MGESELPKPEEMPTFGTAALYSICIAHRQSTPIGLLDQQNMQGDPDEDMPDMNEECPIDPPADRFGLDRPTLGDPSASNPNGSAQNNRRSICAFEWRHFETSPFTHLRSIPDRTLSLWIGVAT